MASYFVVTAPHQQGQGQTPPLAAGFTGGLLCPMASACSPCPGYLGCLAEAGVWAVESGAITQTWGVLTAKEPSLYPSPQEGLSLSCSTCLMVGWMWGQEPCHMKGEAHNLETTRDQPSAS